MAGDAAIETLSPRLHIDGVGKVTGTNLYAGDLRAPRMAYGRLVLSSVPHGTVRSIRADRARALRGVLSIVTAGDLPCSHLHGGTSQERPILVKDVVRYAGEPICVVVGEQAAIAQEGVRFVEVEYDLRPAVTELRDALQPGALRVWGGSECPTNLPRAFPARANIAAHHSITWGAPEAALDRAAAVFQDEYNFPSVPPEGLEGPCALAVANGVRIEVWTNTDEPFRVQDELARTLDVSPQCVRVMVPDVGGAFAARRGLGLEYLAVVLAVKLGRPIQVALSPREFDMVSRRAGLRMIVKTTLDGRGSISSRHATALVDVGAYLEIDVHWDDLLMPLGRGIYSCPNGVVEAALIHTHRSPAQPFRGDLAPLFVWAIESHMDRIATRLGVDPAVLRRTHLVGRGRQAELSSPVTVALDEMLHGIERDLDHPAPETAWNAGRAVAIGMKGNGNPYGSVAIARLHHDGTVTLSVGAVETGVGIRTLAACVLAATLGCPVTDIRVELSDTLLTPYDQGGVGGSNIVACCRAVYQASLALRRQMTAVAGRCWEAPEAAIIISNGRVVWKDRVATFGEILGRFFGARGGDLLARGYARDGGTSLNEPHAGVWSVGASGCQVHMDRETGLVSVISLVIYGDAGRLGSPRLWEIQLEGAAMMALGHILFGAEGVSPALGTRDPLSRVRRLPTFCDLPEITARLTGCTNPIGPFGINNVPDAGMLTVYATIAGAASRAAGIVVDGLPLTPERLWRGVRK